MPPWNSREPRLETRRQTIVRARGLAVSVLAAALVLGGCAVHAELSRQPSGPLGVPVPLATLTCSPPSVPGRLPTGVRWTGVAICPLGGFVLVSPGGSPAPVPVRRPKVVRADVNRLVTALRRPDAARTHDACTMGLVLGPTFWVLDDHGRAWPPRLPLDECGEPAVVSVDRYLPAGADDGHRPPSGTPSPTPR